MIEILAQTEHTVTLRRSDLDALLRRREHLADQAAVAAFADRRRRLGKRRAHRLSYTAAEVTRMLEGGVSSLTIWRERAGLTGRALAALARISASHLCEIEGCRKRGSVATFKALAAALRVPVGDLVADCPGRRDATAVTRS